MNRSTAVLTTLATTVTFLGVTTVAASATVQATPRAAGGEVISSSPAPGTGGLILRDINGRDLGSGIGEDQYFGFNGCGPKGSGLIRVVQITRGHGGGWGPLYAGFVKKRWAAIPSMFEECT